MKTMQYKAHLRMPWRFHGSGRRGLLLPDLEGVDTVERQIEIALQKGGISSKERYTLERFEVVRHI